MALKVSGVDYAWQRPDPDTLKRGGYKFALRYLSHDPTKDLTVAERNRLWALGIGVGVVWETTSNRAMSGRVGGTTDAKTAAAKAKALGLDGIPIYFAVDFDASDSQKPTITAYMQACEAVLGHNRVGVYAGYWVVKHLVEHNVCKWYWQTYAWSGGRIHPAAHIHQYHNAVRLGGGNVDLNHATDAAGGYGCWWSSSGQAASVPAKARSQWESNVKVLSRILVNHPDWPAEVRLGLAWAKNRYVNVLEETK